MFLTPSILRAMVLVLLAGLVTGCAQLQGMLDPDGDAEAQTDEVDAAPAAARAAPEPSAPVPVIEDIIEDLQAGAYADAEQALDRLLEAQPDHPAARSLHRQLTVDPRQALGSAYSTHHVAAGETLAQLAREHLGDASQFVILARYNDLERPAHLLVGQALRIPERKMDTPGPGVEPVQPDPGESPAMAYREAIEEALDAGHYEQALTLTARARAEAPGGAAAGGWLERLEREAEAGYWEQTGDRARAEGAYEDALEAYARALQSDPERASVLEAQERLRVAQKEALHKEAIVRYRNQDLDKAIALWDQALKIDPEFEAARGYRLRAQELQRRLDALDNS
ncbi:tetratricopeptide repeat protein [Thioalkalivibrio sp. ALJ16]|uniref:tetratricopeptide repeat protein n=1 Tax=Thioalkalivibrio sp. ALJ16 TaxID=1158762 RepID=UPI00037D9EBA|nr:tetratricopeptide repeat protein [Thioalkalivibrio sp. ALJ16]